MKIIGFGMDMNGQSLFQPIEEAEAVRSLRDSLERNASIVQKQSELNTRGLAFRGEIQRRVRDAGDPREAGWTFLVAKNDRRRAEIVEILKPLAVHRGMLDPTSPLLFGRQREEEWGEWLQDHYWALDLQGKKVPQYVLLVGSPNELPFRFQSMLDTVADVGRVDFDTLAELEAYVKKIVRIESAAEPVVTRDVLMFGTDLGRTDPTCYSCQYMVEPLISHIKEAHSLNVMALTAGNATKVKLDSALRASHPALVYTASHGLGMIGKPLADQKCFNGAICCQTNGPLTLDDLFSADSVPTDRPFLEGTVFFQFACFGAGTPKQSDYTHWLKGIPEKYAEEDFVAALPKKLLAHPRGPIAFIGHLDTAWLHGFTDADDPNILERWHNRVAPFVRAVDDILSVQPTALALQFMNDRYTATNALLANTCDREKRGRIEWTEELSRRFLDTWIIRSDAQNYMVLGDPAARVRIPAE